MTKVAVGNRVEDTRAKRIFDPDLNDRYSGIFGEITAVESDGAFTVAWEACDETPAYTATYHPDFLKMGITVCE